jgi:type I restriction enzyme R subunit
VSGRYSEDALVERPALDLLAVLGWETVSAFEESFGAGGTLGRGSQREVVLVHRLRDALRYLNPSVPDVQREEAVAALIRGRALMDRVRANREVFELLRDGFSAVWRDSSGAEQSGRVRYIDWHHSDENEWLAASQVWVTGETYKRRTDLILFVNGIPLVLMEFKAANRKVRAAFDENLRDYRSAIPQLFWPNAFVVLSNGSEARLGSTYASWEYFGEWPRIDDTGERGVVGLETLLRATCAKDRLLDLVENFTAFTERPGGLVKAVARCHQFLGVNSAIDKLAQIRLTEDKRLGVFWHTQGSGKSLSMLWFSQKVLRRMPGAWTFVMVTDRTELDEQLHGEFVDSGAIPQQAGVHAESGAHLRELLAGDHRYVFTLIHKFGLNAAEREGRAVMPVLSDRSDIIVITDEAHRSQYDTLALNMRAALPNAMFMGFTGTPLMAGEELTRQEFGDYVSVYNFSDAIADGATVPLFYENRIPELQLTNDHFADELGELLETAELDENAEGALSRRFATEYALITRTERLRTVARDLVGHFVGRGFAGKAMYVAIDKATAVQMHDYVQEAWTVHLGELRVLHDSLPMVERPWVASQIELMETTEMAVVVSQGQNEVTDLEKRGLDIRPHRAKMLGEKLDDRFKDPADPFRLVFVCAMWMTGFDAPSCSTVYLDRPMRNHSLMQTIARANRVFPEKENGLIVDYIGVFRNLERALAIYAPPLAGGEVDAPIKSKQSLVGELAEAIARCAEFCEAYDIDLDDLIAARGFEFINLRDHAVEALLHDDERREEFQTLTRQVRKLFKAILPDPAAAEYQSQVAVIRVLAEALKAVTGGDDYDMDDVIDAVDRLLDRSIGAEEYIIRAAADEQAAADRRIDLSKIDFDKLATKFAGRKRTETERLASLLKQRAVASARKNPTRHDLVRRIEELIAEYNAGSINIDEYLRRLIELSGDLTVEEQRAVVEDMSEEELAIFDLLTNPEPALEDEELSRVRDVAKGLLEHIHEKLVVDWRTRAEAQADMRVTIRRALDNGLPEDPYPRDVFDQKVQAIFDHVVDRYVSAEDNVYTEPAAPSVDGAARGTTLTRDLEAIAVEIEQDDQARRQMLRRLQAQEVFRRTVDELLVADETGDVEYKSTARWNVVEGKQDKAMEDAVIKTVAAFLNTDGGTLLIGVRNDRTIHGLDDDLALFTPPDCDRFVNWLDTKLDAAMGKSAGGSTKITIVDVESPLGSGQVCRVDVPAASRPTWTKTSKNDRIFFRRRSNSTIAFEPHEAEALDEYIADRWPTSPV